MSVKRAELLGVKFLRAKTEYLATRVKLASQITCLIQMWIEVL